MSLNLWHLAAIGLALIIGGATLIFLSGRRPRI